MRDPVNSSAYPKLDYMSSQTEYQYYTQKRERSLIIHTNLYQMVHVFKSMVSSVAALYKQVSSLRVFSLLLAIFGMQVIQAQCPDFTPPFVVDPFTSSPPAVSGFHQDNDGKFTVVGFFTSPGQGICRINANGSLDASFQSNTSFTIGSNAPELSILDVAQLSDGKYIIVGNFEGPKRFVARLNSDGSLDNSFTPPLFSGFGSMDNVIPLANGQLLVSGGFNSPTYVIARLNADGSLDNTFGYAQGQGPNIGSIYDTELLPDGKIIVGTSTGVFRLNANGTVDNTFTSFPTFNNNWVLSVLVLPNGQIMAGGEFTEKVVRLNSNGTVDNTFTLPAFPLAFQSVWDMSLDATGKVVIGGTFPEKIRRLNSDGSTDTSFEAQDLLGGFAVRHIQLLPSGYLMAAGNFVSQGSDNDVSMAVICVESCTLPNTPGAIAGVQTICSGDTPATLTSTSGASGEVGILEYRWQRSTTSASAGFTDIANSNTATYTPTALTQTTWFRRLAGVDCQSDWTNALASNAIQVTVRPVVPPTISCSNQTVFFNGESSIALNLSNLASATADCGIQSLTASLTSISCATVGSTVAVVVTAVANGGGSASCTSQITVQGLPCGWRQQANGVNCSNGNSASYNAATGEFTVMTDNCHTPINPHSADGFGFAQRTLCGNGSLQAQVTSINGLGWAGLSIRESNAAGAKKVHLLTNRAMEHRREIRSMTNGVCIPAHWSALQRYWLRLVRSNNQIIGYVSPNGINWYQAMVANVAMNQCVEVGLMTFHNSSTGDMISRFANVSFSGSAPALSQLEDHTAAHTTAGDLSVFPNPSAGTIHVDLDQPVAANTMIEILDPLGRVLMTRELGVSEDQLQTLELPEHQADGVYFLRLLNEGRISRISRFVLQRNR